MQIDRRTFLATLGTAATINAMPSETLADALEHHMMEKLDAETTTNELKVRRGTGTLFGGPGPLDKKAPELLPLAVVPIQLPASFNRTEGSSHLCSPASLTRFWARAIDRPSRSTPTTSPDGLTTRATSIATSPMPLPRSSTR